MTADPHSIVHGWDKQLNALPLSPANAFHEMLERTVFGVERLARRPSGSFQHAPVATWIDELS